MAKKVIASLTKGDGKKLTKFIQVKRSTKTGAYTFRGKIVPSEMVKEMLSSKA